MIRLALPDDAARLAEIQVFGWRTAYRGILSDAYLFGTMSVPRRIEQFRGALTAGTEETYVAEEAGLVHGFVTLGPCRDEDRSGDFEIWGVYVDPGFQRRGIGGLLVEKALTLGRDRGHDGVNLWLLEQNAASRAFYEALGFALDGTRQCVDYLDANVVRMRRTLR